MISLSTGLRMAIAGNYGLGAMMNGGIIRVYGGTRPNSPDDPPEATELGRVTTEGKEWFADTDPNNAGLILQLVSPGGLMNDGLWQLKGIANGTATWFRWCWAAADPLLESTYYPRVDGDIGVTPGEGDPMPDLILATTAITTATARDIDTFLFLLPLMEGQ